MKANTAMRRFTTASAAGSIALVLLWSVATTHAQTQRSGSDNARIVQQLQQVTAEKSKLQLDNDALKKELEELKSKSAQATAEQSRLQQRARELEQAGEKLRGATTDNDEALQKSRAQLQELIGKFRETAQTLKDVETERDSLKAGKTVQDRELATCVDKNAQMYLLSDEVLGKLENQGIWSAMKNKELFTQLSRTRLENMVDDYRYRINELKLVAKAAAAASPSAK